jgi:hypothetical protein
LRDLSRIAKLVIKFSLNNGGFLMSHSKTILLGSAAAFIAIAGASAADLGAKKPAAATYVKECPTHGAGFFVVPGTTSCLKIIGRVRADYTIDNPQTRGNDRATPRNTFTARGYFGYDHRTSTEYGLLRTYVRGFLGRNNNVNLTNTASGAELEYAFVQFGGLTAGRIGPIFEHGFAFSLDGSGANGGFSDITSVNSLGYSHDFGSGFKGTLAIDSAAERRSAIEGGGGYAGQALPDVVGALDYEQSWGAVKLAGALHQVRTTQTTTAASVGLNATETGVVVLPGSVSGVKKTEYGYAGTLGAKFNLPVLNKGTNLWFSGTFARGANSYAGFGTITAGQASITSADATVVGNRLKLSTTYAFAGGIQAYFTPTIYAGLSGNYGVYDPTGARNRVNAYTARGTIGWQPVAGLDLVGELSYFAIDAKTGANHGQVLAGTDKSNWSGRLRVQRDF